MPELLALTSRHLRATARAPATRAGALLFLLALAGAVLAPDEARGAGLALLASLVVLTFFVSGFAVGAGAALPEDRVAGRETWLAALAPSAWKRRLAVILAAWLLAVGLGLVGGGIIGALVAVARPDAAVRGHTGLGLPDDAVLVAGAEPVVVALPSDDARPDVEIDVRPLYRLQTAPVDRVAVAWASGAAAGVLQVSARGPLALRPPPGARSLSLRLTTPHVRLRLVAARRLGPPRAPWGAVLWTGLLLGLLAGAIAPVAVLVSRATTAQTASAAAFVLLLLGIAKPGLLALASDLRPEGLMAIAPGLLRAAAWLAPDAPVLDLVAEAGALRAPGLATAALLGPTLLYTAVACALACWPVPRRCAEGVNA